MSNSTCVLKDLTLFSPAFSTFALFEPDLWIWIFLAVLLISWIWADWNTEMSPNILQQKSGQTVPHPHYVILLSNKKEQTIDTCNDWMNIRALHWVKKVTRFHTVRSNYTTFFLWQNFRNERQISGWQGLEIKWRSRKSQGKELSVLTKRENKVCTLVMLELYNTLAVVGNIRAYIGDKIA